MIPEAFHYRLLTRHVQKRTGECDGKSDFLGPFNMDYVWPQKTDKELYCTGLRASPKEGRWADGRGHEFKPLANLS